MTTGSAGAELKPQPRVSSLTRPFWDGVNAHRLMIQRCTSADCGKAIFYPRVCCPFCKAPRPEWIQASGAGRVIAHTIVHRTHHAGFDAEAPYVFAAIELAEGPCVYAQIRGASLVDECLRGTAVQVEYVQHGPDRLMLVFRLSNDSQI